MVIVNQLMQVVLDTNIFISALISLKNCHFESKELRILRQLEANKFLLMLNSMIIGEYRKKGEEKVCEGKILGTDLNKWIDLVQKIGRFDRFFINPPIHVQTDPSDNIFFSSPNCLNANFFITGNSTDMNPIKGDIKQLRLRLKIVSPHEFLLATTRSYKKEIDLMS